METDSKIKYVIGIDPGKNTGWAIYSRESKKIEEIKTLTFWDCYDEMKHWTPEITLVVVECPIKNALYARQEKIADQGSMRRGNRMMANASANAHEASLLADGIERLGFEVRRVRPTRRNFKSAEDDVAYVQRITGFEGRTNPHTRDAIMLCWAE
jgi:hypothetical protein